MEPETNRRPKAKPAWVRDVTADAIQHFAWGVGDDNPLWCDPAYAERTRWGEILAPPCFPYALHETTVAPGHPDRPRVYRAVEWQWFDVIRIGAELEPTAVLRESRDSEDGPLQTGTVRFGNVARASAECLRPAEPVNGTGESPSRYSALELAEIEGAILGEKRRGADTRYFEDTPIGSQLGPLTKGPLSIMDIVAWCAGALGVPGADAPISAGGLLDEVATGPQLTAWFAHLITDWAGDDAFLHRLQVKLLMLPALGSTTRLRGEVSHRFSTEQVHAVEIDLVAADQDDHSVATGRALVLLPSKDLGPPRLPLAGEVNRP